MKPFRLPAWRERLIREKFRRHDRVVHSTVHQLGDELKKAVDFIFSFWQRTGTYQAPDLNGIEQISERFYRSVLEQGYIAAKDERTEAKGRKRLARGPVGLPHELDDIRQVFRDPKRWAVIQRRSNALSRRLRQQYLEKLRKKFRKIIPQVLSNEITPQEAKNALMDSWHTSKARTETIFRTETSNYFAATQLSYFAGDPNIIGFLFDSVADKARTPICKSRHGLVYRPDSALLRANTPSLHFNCRSHLIALANTPYNRKLLEDPKRDPEKVSVVPLDPDWRK